MASPGHRNQVARTTNSQIAGQFSRQTSSESTAGTTGTVLTGSSFDKEFLLRQFEKINDKIKDLQRSQAQLIQNRGVILNELMEIKEILQANQEQPNAMITDNVEPPSRNNALSVSRFAGAKAP